MIIVLAIISTLIGFLLLALILGFFFFAIDTFLDLPYVATKREKIATIIKLAGIKPKETVVDLGSGDGRLLFAAAQKGARAVGYEVNPYLVILTRLKYQFLKRNIIRSYKKTFIGPVTVYRQSLWQADLKKANIIFVYGRGKTMKRFEDFVFKNARKGTRIIVNTDLTKPFPTKRPLKSENGIFLYKV